MIEMLELTWHEADRVADLFAQKALELGIAQIFGVPKGGLPLAVMVSARLDDMPLVDREDKISVRTMIIEDIIHTGVTLGRILGRQRGLGVRPYVACWVVREDAPDIPEVVIVGRRVGAGTPVKFPHETRESARKSFDLSEQGRR